MLPRMGWPVAYWASAGTGPARSTATARAPAALILWRPGKDANLDRRRGAERPLPRVRPAVARESLGGIELTGSLVPCRNGKACPDRASNRANIRPVANGGAR